MPEVYTAGTVDLYTPLRAARHRKGDAPDILIWVLTDLHQSGSEAAPIGGDVRLDHQRS